MCMYLYVMQKSERLAFIFCPRRARVQSSGSSERSVSSRSIVWLEVKITLAGFKISVTIISFKVLRSKSQQNFSLL